jgi:uncharacterized protein (DUF58 family)
MKKVRKIKSGGRLRLVLALFFVLSGALMYSGDRMLMWGVMCCLGVLSGAVFWQLLTGALLVIHSEVDESDPVKGQSIQLTVDVRNRAPFPILWMEATCQTIDGLFHGAEPVIALSIPPFGHQLFTLEMGCPYKGVFETGIMSLRLQDPLGILRFRPRPHGRPLSAVTVWPRRIQVPDSEESLAVMDEKTAPRRDYSEDLSSIHQIRDWRAGDALKRVHWKLTARTGSLMVKEFDSTTRDEIAVILDARSGPGSRLDLIRFEDALIEAAYSVIATLLDDGRPLRMTTHTEELMYLHGSDAADIPRFYRFLSLMPVSGTHSAEEIITFEAPQLARGGRMIVIGGMPDEGLLASLTALSDEGIAVTLVIAVPSAAAYPIPQDIAERLSEAGIPCMRADPDQGLSLVSSSIPAPVDNQTGARP